MNWIPKETTFTETILYISTDFKDSFFFLFKVSALQPLTNNILESKEKEENNLEMLTSQEIQQMSREVFWGAAHCNSGESALEYFFALVV